jgi:hypothetical protein
VPTLILSPRQTEDSQLLWRTAGQLGWNVERLASWRAPESLLSAQEPVLYVEALMAPTLAEFFHLDLIEPPGDWLTKLPQEYRKRTIRLSTLGQERQNSGPAFIKPPNDKSFQAQVYLGSELPTAFPDDTAVLVSELVHWEKEFRCFLLDRQLRTFSVYLRDGELQRSNDFAMTEQERAEVSQFVATVLADQRVQIPPTVVMDVGFIRDRGWAVVELNAAWGAGLYGCDPVEVLEVLRHAAIPA